MLLLRAAIPLYAAAAMPETPPAPSFSSLPFSR